MPKGSTRYTLTRDDEDIELICEFTYTEYRPPSFDRPPSGGEVRDLIAWHGGDLFTLTDEEESDAILWIEDHFNFGEG